MSNYSDWTNQELRDHAQGCNETTCPQHGKYVLVLKMRDMKRSG